MRVLALCGLGLLTGCAGIAVVDSGHAAVLMTAEGNLSTLGEGASDIPPGAQVDDFDLREQQLRTTFSAVTRDAVPVVVANPSVSYRWVPEELVEADRTVGRDGAPALVTAVAAASIAQVLSTYRFDALDSGHTREAEQRVLERMQGQLRPRHLFVESVELKGISAKLEGLARAVTATSIWEQRALTAQTGVELARQRADRLRAEANGIAAANGDLSPTLTAAVQQDKADRAWRALLTAPGTQVQLSSSPSSNLEVSP